MSTPLGQQLRAGTAHVLVAAVRVYQACVRPLFPSVCRFYPSCSEYFVQAVQKHGPLKGAGLGVWRCVRCHPLTKGGYDPP